MKYEYFEDDIVFLAKQYGCSTASFKIRILKGSYLQNEKVLEAQILSGLYWEYIYVLLVM